MNENTNQNTEQQPTTPTPEGTGGRTFTQEEVNKIVSDRLARAKRETATDEREAALRAKEARLDCREYLSDKRHSRAAWNGWPGCSGAWRTPAPPSLLI